MWKCGNVRIESGLICLIDVFKLESLFEKKRLILFLRYRFPELFVLSLSKLEWG